MKRQREGIEVEIVSTYDFRGMLFVYMWVCATRQRVPVLRLYRDGDGMVDEAA